MKIKAVWTSYGPQFYHKGKKVANGESWIRACYDLENYLEHSGLSGEPTFYGSSASCARESWEAWKK